MRKVAYTRDCFDPEGVPGPVRPLPPRPLAHRAGGGARTPGPRRRVFTLGVGGPVGSGKTALVERLCREFWPAHDLAVVTNDIYTREDAEFLARGRCCRWSASSASRPAAARTAPSARTPASTSPPSPALEKAFPRLAIVIIESGGDNLAATFSPELADRTIYVIDVAEGDKIPRKGGPGITRSDLLVINKIDLAPHVGADLEVMRRDSLRMRGDRPFLLAQPAQRRRRPGTLAVGGTAIRISASDFVIPPDLRRWPLAAEGAGRIGGVRLELAAGPDGVASGGLLPADAVARPAALSLSAPAGRRCCTCSIPPPG